MSSQQHSVRTRRRRRADADAAFGVKRGTALCPQCGETGAGWGSDAATATSRGALDALPPGAAAVNAALQPAAAKTPAGRAAAPGPWMSRAPPPPPRAPAAGSRDTRGAAGLFSPRFT